MELFSIPILIAIIVNVFAGAFYYSPRALGKQWAAAHGFNVLEMKPAPLHYMGAIAVTIVMVITLANLLHMANITGVWHGIKFGLLLWLGLIATTHFSGVIWAKKSIQAYAIDISYLLIIILINMVILTIMK